MLDKGFKEKITKTQTRRLDTLKIFKEINLTDILDSEEIEEFLKEGNLNEDGSDFLLTRKKTGSLSRKENSQLNYHFDRTSLIIKFLKITISKLKSLKQTMFSKGLEWYF